MVKKQPENIPWRPKTLNLVALEVYLVQRNDNQV